MILSGAFDRIGIYNVVSYERKELSHVAGRIRGISPENCVVISAHFDGVGLGGASFFPGALSNASGTAALLYIAERLKSLSVAQPFDFDIIIAFFNGEKHHYGGTPLGSRYFVPVVMNDYEKVYNINIDSVGAGEAEAYLTGGSGNQALSEALASFAALRGIICDNSRFAMSSSTNFIDMGVPSINFMSAVFVDSGAAFTNRDIADRLQYPQIVRLSDMIVDFLAQGGNSVFDSIEKSQLPADMPLPPPYIEHGGAAMIGQFRRVFNALRAGESVRFYEDFYAYYPWEEQRFFSYYEALEMDEGLAHIRSFGDYRLDIIGDVPGFSDSDFMYFHILEQNALPLRIRPVPPSDFEDLPTHTQIHVVDIQDLPGHVILFITPGNIYHGFGYSDGDIAFAVSSMRMEAMEVIGHNGPAIAMHLISESVNNNKDAYIEFIRSLRFDEFLENWRVYSS